MNETRLMPGWRASSGPLRLASVIFVAAGCLIDTGCCVSPEVRQTAHDAGLTDIPTEMQKVSIPPYRVEAPDILIVEAVNNIRPPSDPLRAGDELVIRASNTLPIDPMGDPVQNDFQNDQRAIPRSRPTARSTSVPNMDQSSSKALLSRRPKRRSSSISAMKPDWPTPRSPSRFPT